MVFNGSGSIFQIKTNLGNFRNYEILRKSDKVSKNFNNKKALEIPKYLAGNWTRTKDEVPNIRDGLVHRLRHGQSVSEFSENRCAVAYYLFVIFYRMAFLNGHALLSLTLSMNIPATQYFFIIL